MMEGSLCGWTLRGPKASSKIMSMIIWQISAGTWIICSSNSFRATAARQAWFLELNFSWSPKGSYLGSRAALGGLFVSSSWQLVAALDGLFLAPEGPAAVRFVLPVVNNSCVLALESLLDIVFSHMKRAPGLFVLSGPVGPWLGSQRFPVGWLLSVAPTACSRVGSMRVRSSVLRSLSEL